MSRRLKLITGISGVILVVAVALLIFIRYQLTKAFPLTDGSAILPSLQRAVDVYRDDYGVPHIVAGNDRDALVAIGFVHAQDRLWQMDLQRRAGAGRLSEIFGKATVPFDRMFRIIGLRRIAVDIEAHLPAETRNALQAYCEGVNAARASAAGTLPIEFDLLRYDPDPWTPVDCILVSRLLAWELNLSWWTDITYGGLAARIGKDTLAQILPTYPQSVAPQVPAEEWGRYVAALRGYLTTSRDYLASLGRPLPTGGSNAWVVAPAKSATGAVLLANDTHLHLTQPSQWYELGVRAPGFSVHGMSVPGAPGIVAGTNDSIAWGITNLMADDADFFLERLHPSDTAYWRNDGWHPLGVHDEEIGVRGDTAVIVRVRSTDLGPLITDIHTPLSRATIPFTASMRWVGAELDDQIGAFLHIDRARNWKEFTDGLRTFAVPGQNFVYGDVRGNIGYYCAARIPVRAFGRGLLPVPAWNPTSAWRGFVPFEQLPHLFNPPTGTIASANNKTVDDTYPYYIGDLWEPPSRIQHLRAALDAPHQITPQECMQLQNDTYSPLARELTPFLLAAATDSVLGPEYADVVRDYLTNWDFRFGENDIATSLFQEFLLHLIRNIYADEMGEDLFHDFTMLVNIPLRVTTRLLKEGSSVWFDDVRTPAVETRDDIVRRSARDALQDLVARAGTDPRLWRWGDLHTVTLQHPFGLQQPLDKIFSIGPYPYPGGSTALTSGEYSLTAPFAVTVGPSFRQVFSFAEKNRHYAILPSGESGQVYNPHYHDQTSLWLHGGYRNVLRGQGQPGWDRLRLEPSGSAQ